MTRADEGQAERREEGKALEDDSEGVTVEQRLWVAGEGEGGESAGGRVGGGDGRDEGGS